MATAGGFLSSLTGTGANIVAEEHLVRFVAVLAAVEVATTFLLVDELRTDAWLGLYLVAGLAIVPTGLLLLRKHRARVFAT